MGYYPHFIMLKRSDYKFKCEGICDYLNPLEGCALYLFLNKTILAIKILYIFNEIVMKSICYKYFKTYTYVKN